MGPHPMSDKKSMAGGNIWGTKKNNFGAKNRDKEKIKGKGKGGTSKQGTYGIFDARAQTPPSRIQM